MKFLIDAIKIRKMLWLLFQFSVSIGLSYGGFLALYYYALKLYKDNPPKTINLQLTDKDEWEKIVSGCDRYPFYMKHNTVWRAEFDPHPVKNRENPCVIVDTVRFSCADYGVYFLDQTALWYSLVCLGRTTEVFVALQLINLFICGVAGYAYGFADPVASYAVLKKD